MKGLEIEYNGEKWVAAIEKGVVTAITTIVTRDDKTEINFHLGGLTTQQEPNEHLKWLDKPLLVDDTITVKVVEVDEASPVTERYEGKGKCHR